MVGYAIKGLTFHLDGATYAGGAQVWDHIAMQMFDAHIRFECQSCC